MAMGGDHGPGMMAGGPGMMRGGGPGGPGGMMGGFRGRGFTHHGGFSATRLAEALKVETGPEAHALAQSAVDANGAAERAALAGNTQEAGRASRVAADLMAAVDDLVRLNHPPSAPRTMRRPLSG